MCWYNVTKDRPTKASGPGSVREESVPFTSLAFRTRCRYRLLQPSAQSTKRHAGHRRGSYDHIVEPRSEPHLVQRRPQAPLDTVPFHSPAGAPADDQADPRGPVGSLHSDHRDPPSSEPDSMTQYGIESGPAAQRSVHPGTAFRLRQRSSPRADQTANLGSMPLDRQGGLWDSSLSLSTISRRGAVNSRGQPSTSFPAAAFEDGASLTRPRPPAEPVLALPAASVGLIGTLHGNLPWAPRGAGIRRAGT